MRKQSQSPAKPGDTRNPAPARGAATLARAAILAAALTVAGCATTAIRSAKPKPAAAFVLGADISALDAPGRPGFGPLPAYQEDGRPSDELTILHRHGWNAFRVRVFVPPVRNAPNNTVAAAIPLARRIKAMGATFMLDLHFSDTWADPQRQNIPAIWRGMDIAQLEKAWEAYARDTIRRFKEAGAMPDWVQIGNEITRGAAWPLAELQIPGSTLYPPPQPYDEARQWANLTGLLKAAIRGVQSASGSTPPRIAIHIDKGAHWKVTRWYFDHLNAAHVPYDIIAESFYPEWNHGTLEQLWNNMQRCAARYHKDFLVAETGYGPSHVPGNTSMLWPLTPQGRLQYMADIIATVKKAPHGLGVMYWAPERQAWNADGTPGPVVYVLDRLPKLTARPASHAPRAVHPCPELRPGVPGGGGSRRLTPPARPAPAGAAVNRCRRGRCRGSCHCRRRSPLRRSSGRDRRSRKRTGDCRPRPRARR